MRGEENDNDKKEDKEEEKYHNRMNTEKGGKREISCEITAHSGDNYVFGRGTMLVGPNIFHQIQSKVVERTAVLYYLTVK